jgi:hypothetical protein
MKRAKELKEERKARNSDYSYHLDRIEAEMEEANGRGETSMNYDLRDAQEYYNLLADTLIAHGYSVSWNRACLWMEISWE